MNIKEYIKSYCVPHQESMMWNTPGVHGPLEVREYARQYPQPLNLIKLDYLQKATFFLFFLNEGLIFLLDLRKELEIKMFGNP